MLKNLKVEFHEFSKKRLNHWQKIYSQPSRSWGSYHKKNIANIYQQNINTRASVLELGSGGGALLAALNPSHGVGIDFCHEAVKMAKNKFPELDFIVADAHQSNLPPHKYDYIVASELVNDIWDVQQMLKDLQRYCSPRTRLIINIHSHLWNIPIKCAQKLGIATQSLPQNWLTTQDVKNLLEISEFETIRIFSGIVAPLRVPFISTFINRFLSKIWPFNLLAMNNFIIARLQTKPIKYNPTVSVIIAAKNEAGNIEELIQRIPSMGGGTEIIFVEGNSTDETYKTIQNAIDKNSDINCKLLKQDGKGKGDAVRKGFSHASGDILIILDADITVPPEELDKFFQVIARGQAEFVNGVRLVYPMEKDAMQTANIIGNKFFSFAFSWLLGQPIRDTLCGTKALWREDYELIARNRSYFGDFDPFGDFDLLFGAAKLNLKIIEVPIRYRARRYGETNISRWFHGYLLLKMVLFAAKKIKFI